MRFLVLFLLSGTFCTSIFAQNVNFFVAENRCDTYKRSFEFLDPDGNRDHNDAYVITWFFDNKDSLNGKDATYDFKNPGLHMVNVRAMRKFDSAIFYYYRTLSVDTIFTTKWGRPFITSASVQCFENNLIVLKDTNKWNYGDLVKYRVHPNDGQLFEFSNPQSPFTAMFSWKDQRGGLAEISISITGKNGCFLYTDTIKHTTIREKIGVRFSVKLQDSASKKYTFTNLTQISLLPKDTVEWSFMDGSEVKAAKNSNLPEVGTFFTKTFGSANLVRPIPILRVKTFLGCADSFRFLADTLQTYQPNTAKLCKLIVIVDPASISCPNAHRLRFEVTNKYGNSFAMTSSSNDTFTIQTHYTSDSLYLYVRNALNGNLQSQKISSFRFDSAGQVIYVIKPAINLAKPNGGRLMISSNRARYCGYQIVSIRCINPTTNTLTNTEILVQIPPFVILYSSNKTYSKIGPCIYKFQAGNIAACGSFDIQLVCGTNCNNDKEIIGLTQCIQAWLDYDGLTSAASHGLSFQWKTNGNKLIYTIKNSGTNDMAQPEYLLSSRGIYTIQLKRGDSLDFQELFQPGESNLITAYYNDGHPLYEASYLQVKYGTNKSFYIDTFRSQIADSIFVSTIKPLLYSYDPNAKTLRYAHDPKNTKGPYSLEYTIHFQNTGSDTAHKVVIKDPLFGNYDHKSLEIISASHPMDLSITDGVAVFTFDSIYLVDSTTNAALSQGYVTYKINALSDNIRNYADIFFDLNDPVKTNTCLFQLPPTNYNTLKPCRNYTTADAGADKTVCSNSSLLETNAPLWGNGYWQVLKGNASVWYNYDAKYYMNFNSDTVLLRWSLAGCTDTVHDDVVYTRPKVYSLAPQVLIKSKDSIYCNLNADSYEWYVDGILLPDTTKTIHPTWYGYYSVKIVQGGCASNFSTGLHWNPSLNMKAIATQKYIAYPNPVGEVLYFGNLNQRASVILFDLTGRKEAEYHLSPSNAHISVSSLRPGLHLATIIGEDGSKTTLSFIKQ